MKIVLWKDALAKAVGKGVGRGVSFETPAITIVRLPEYEECLEVMLARDEHRREFDEAVDQELVKHPDGGDLVVGTGGFRKMRVARPDQPKGKSGGARVMY